MDVCVGRCCIFTKSTFVMSALVCPKSLTKSSVTYCRCNVHTAFNIGLVFRELGVIFATNK